MDEKKFLILKCSGSHRGDDENLRWIPKADDLREFLVPFLNQNDWVVVDYAFVENNATFLGIEYRGLAVLNVVEVVEVAKLQEGIPNFCKKMREESRYPGLTLGRNIEIVFSGTKSHGIFEAFVLSAIYDGIASKNREIKEMPLQKV